MMQIIALPEFEREIKRLNKKYGSLKEDFIHFIELTEQKGPQGIPLGNGLFKARMSVKSKGKGKRGGLRVISYFEIILSEFDTKLYLVSIYDKSELSSIDVRYLNIILRNNGL